IWPFSPPAPSYAGLPLVAARLAGASLSGSPHDRWLRYYNRQTSWERLSYWMAYEQTTNSFQDKIVFIGSKPETSMPGDEDNDEFRVPDSRWTGESAGGVEIMITAFLNLKNHEWLERPPWWLELLFVVATGLALGGTLCRLRPKTAIVS